jgi:hypothetical protein
MFHDSLDEEIEGARHDLGEVSARERVAQEISREVELVLEVGVDRELELVAVRGERLEMSGAGWPARGGV